MSAKVKILLCPKCCALAAERLPHGTLGPVGYVCLECGHTWHEAEPAKPEPSKPQEKH